VHFKKVYGKSMVTAELEPRLLLDPQVLDDPADFYRRLREEAPVWRVDGTEVVVVSTFDAVAEAVKRTDDFSSNLRALLYRNDDGTPASMPFDAGEAADVLATADPPAHTLHRKMVFPELVAKRMASLRPDVEDITDACLDAALGLEPFEFMAAVANAVPIRVVSRLIGFRDEDPDELLEAAFSSTGMLAATHSLDGLFATMARAAEIMFWIAEQLDAAISNGADGILGQLASAISRGDLDRDAGIVMLHTLLSAGGESTTSLLGNATSVLAQRPDLQDRLRAEPEMLAAFIEEMLRLEAPFRYHMRSAPHDTELGGVEIPAGSAVLLLWGSANRDRSEYGEGADEVQLDRDTLRHHVGFGRGIHLCVGAPLARLEAEVVLGRFLERTSTFTLDRARRPVREESLMVRRFVSLPLEVSAR
jgi:cytochrome P450